MQAAELRAGLLESVFQVIFPPSLQLLRNPVDRLFFTALQILFEIRDQVCLTDLLKVLQLNLHVAQRPHPFKNLFQPAPELRHFGIPRQTVR